jgi:hypothetical protein
MWRYNISQTRVGAQKFPPPPEAGQANAGPSVLTQCLPDCLNPLVGDAVKESGGKQNMFRIHDWSFSGTAEIAVGVMLILTMIVVAFA